MIRVLKIAVVAVAVLLVANVVFGAVDYSDLVDLYRNTTGYGEG